MEVDNYQPKDSYLRVATACPEVCLADVKTNVDRIIELYAQADAQDVSLVAFPEMSLTGYTLGDLVNQNSLLEQAKAGIQQLAQTTHEHNAAMVVGLPLQVGNNLYNCAALLADGQIKGIVPKSNLPTYNEFYEDRWFEAWSETNTTVQIGGQQIPFGKDILFDVAGSRCGIEICEDLWVGQPPSGDLAAKGAQLIINPSASPEQVGKATYRRDLVSMQSGRLVCGYLYAGCDVSESTAEIVMGGHQIIAANGVVQAERPPFGRQPLTISDIDIEHLSLDRRKQHVASQVGPLVVEANTARQQEDLSLRVDRNPFLPIENSKQRDERLRTAIYIQAHGLAQRMKATHQNSLVLGLSGGLDSTLALLVACEAAQILGRQPGAMIHTLTMPGLASSEQTQSNAQLLAAQLGVKNTVIPINDLSETMLNLIGHDGNTQDITYENVQARARTDILFNYGNLNGCMTLGTGDLSEIALGWCTYNADQQSHYNVNASIPKTLVRHLVGFMAEQPEYVAAKQTLLDIVDTPVSPELTSNRDGKISQTTEDIIGPYELHDFFLYHLLRWGDKPAKIAYLAGQAFEGDYQQPEINKWLGVFVRRFAQNQFKRDNMPNGPKAGSVSLSPRGDWRMPSDLFNAAIWDMAA